MHRSIYTAHRPPPRPPFSRCMNSSLTENLAFLHYYTKYKKKIVAVTKWTSKTQILGFKKKMKAHITSILTFPNGSNIPLSISSVMLKCSEPTYSLIGPSVDFCGAGLEAGSALFFSACEGCTIIGTPKSFCPDSPMANGTDSTSANST